MSCDRLVGRISVQVLRDYVAILDGLLNLWVEFWKRVYGVDLKLINVVHLCITVQSKDSSHVFDSG